MVPFINKCWLRTIFTASTVLLSNFIRELRSSWEKHHVWGLRLGSHGTERTFDRLKIVFVHTEPP